MVSFPLPVTLKDPKHKFQGYAIIERWASPKQDEIRTCSTMKY